jgi:hypothetical protein
MKPEIAAKWVDALRSGKYGQAAGRLRAGASGFCCLGVLCDLYSEEHASFGGKACWADDDTFLGKQDHLPKDVSEWAGMHSANGTLLCGYVDVEVGDVEPCHVTADNLADMNDEGCEFKHIADVISSHVEDL